MTLRWNPEFARKGDWQKRFGAARLKLDRAILAEAERQYSEPVQNDARQRLARAFGRPVA